MQNFSSIPNSREQCRERDTTGVLHGKDPGRHRRARPTHVTVSERGWLQVAAVNGMVMFLFAYLHAEYQLDLSKTLATFLPRG